jgi:hypothetical protein
LSKIIPFRVHQIIQQAVIRIYLKMTLSKSALACRIMSRGLRFIFQIIGMVSQQSRLKGHSKKRWNIVSSHPELHSTQL